MAPVVRLRTTNHPFHPIHPFTRQLVPSLFEESISRRFVEIYLAILLIQPYKCLPVTTKIFTWQSFFFLSFITHFFRGLAGAFVNPRSFFKLPFYTFTCLSNNSLISLWISAKFVSALLLCMLYLSYYYQSEVNT